MSVEKKNFSDDITVSDNFIYCSLEHGIIRKGKMRFDKGMINLSARAVADYIKSNREKIEEITTE